MTTLRLSYLLFLISLFLLLLAIYDCEGSNKVKAVIDSKLEKIKQRLGRRMKSEEVDEIASKLKKLRGIGKERLTKKYGKVKSMSMTAFNTNATTATTESNSTTGPDMSDFLFQGDMLLRPKQIDALIAIAEKNEAAAVVNEAKNVTTESSAANNNKAAPTHSKVGSGARNKTGPPPHRRQKRQAVDWEGTGYTPFDKTQPIYYKFDGSFTITSRKNLFRKAAADWADHSCLNLVEGTGDQQLLITSEESEHGACWSWWGYDPEGTQINLYNGCELYETYAHEIGHALGFWHTFARWDRDDYIDLRVANDGQYKMETEERNNNFDLPYDLESVMHYPSDPDTGDMGADDSRRKYIIGSENLITFTDYNMVNKLYSCEESCPSGVDCHNGGFRNPNDCDVCICPRGFTGNDCSEEATSEYTTISCGGSLTATSGSKTKTYTLAPNYSSKKIEPATCYWHIHAPACKQIKVKFNSFTGPSITEFPCSNFGLEFRGESFEIAGYRICKSTQAPKTFTAAGDYGIVTAFTKQYSISTSFSYWFVDKVQDLDPECSLYGEELCTDEEWGDWMSENCANFCNVCD